MVICESLLIWLANKAHCKPAYLSVLSFKLITNYPQHIEFTVHDYETGNIKIIKKDFNTEKVRNCLAQKLKLGCELDSFRGWELVIVSQNYEDIELTLRKGHAEQIVRYKFNDKVKIVLK